MRKWLRFLPMVSSVSTVVVATEVLSAMQKW